MATTFHSLGISEILVETLKKQNFSKPTPVQSATIPQLLGNRDVTVEACTGSGKTLAYLIPTLEILSKTKEEREGKKCVGGLILSPTRELAIQIHRVAQPFCNAMDISSILLTSGDQANKKNRKQSVNEIVEDIGELMIGTPGRLDEWSEKHRSELKTLEVLILDEADTLLSLGFQISIQSILSRLPKQRRTGLFSATQAKEIQTLIRAGMRNPANICVKVLRQQVSTDKEPEFQRTPNRLSNYYKLCEADEKLQFVYDFINEKPRMKLIIFFATCASVDYFGDCILKNLLKDRIYTLHGKMNPKRRALTFEAFVKSEMGILLCTDVAARGIDLPDVDWIIQMDAPKEPDFFVHRVGRTARAGRLGSALLMLLPNEFAYIEYLAAQKVPVDLFEETPKPTEIPVLEKSRELVFSDRDILEKGTRAFIAYLAYYNEHRLTALFQITELDFLKLIRSFNLLRLPKLKEFRNEKIREQLKSFVEESEEVISAIKFKQVAREQKRKRLLEQGPSFNQEKREKKQQKAAKKAKLEKTSEKGGKKKKKGQHEKILEDWDELLKEEQLFKRHRKGKIADAEYEKALMDDVYLKNE